MVQNISKAQFLNLQANQVKKTDDAYIPNAYRDVASGMEKMFAQMMLEHMERTAEKAEEDDSPATRFYSSLQMDQRADSMTQQGLGVQPMILDQIYPQELRTEDNLQAFAAQEKARMPHKKALEMYQQRQDQIKIAMPSKQDALTNNGIEKYRQEDVHE